MEISYIQSAILDSAALLIFAYDNQLNTVYINPYAYKILGYSFKEIGYKLTPELMYDAENADRVRQLMKVAMREGSALGEAEVITKNSNRLLMQLQLFAIKNSDNEQPGVGIIMSDITQCHSNRHGIPEKSSNIESISDFNAIECRDIKRINTTPRQYPINAELLKREEDKMLDVLKNILDQLDAVIYVSDMETHELLFINKTMKDTFNIGDDVTGLPCWSVIQQGMTGRCPFCPMNSLEKDPNTTIEWETTNTINGRRYHIVDTVIEWTNGKPVHMEYAIDVTEVRKLQQEADNSLRILKNILNGMDAYVYVSDMDTDEILFINKRMQETFGSDESINGKICWKVLQNNFSERCDFCPCPKLAENPDTSIVWEENNTVTERHYKNVDSVIEWLDGKKVHMQHSTDITDIFEAQKEIKETQERLEMALTASHAGVWELNIKQNSYTYDKWSGRLLGLEAESGTISIEELIAHLENIIDEETCPDMFDALRKKDLFAEWPERDTKLVFPDKTVRYIRSYANTVRDEEGHTIRIIGMNIDITENVNLQNELKEAKITAENEGRVDADARAQIMLDATPLAASFWDEQGNILDCNMECVRLFGIKEKEEYTKNFYKLSPEYQPDGTLSTEKAAFEIAEAFRTGHRRFEWTYKTFSGEYILVDTTLVRVKWKDEYRIAAYSRDLREIRTSEQIRRDAEKRSLEMEVQARSAIAASEAKSQFLSNMSHEIRTPMNAVIGMADLLANEKLNEKQTAYVNDIRTSATSLLGIINDVLDFSKIEAGKLNLVPTDYDLIQLLRNLESMFIFTAEEKGISFEMHIMNKLPECLFGDDIRVRQILVNILGNAVKFTKQGGVTFSIRADADTIYFNVSDTGIGIKPEYIDRVFNKFDRLDMSAHRNIAGTGLGLSITKNLVTMMDGDVRVESEYGKGSTFYLELPLVLGNAENLSEKRKEWAPVFAPDAQILIVDDNDINLGVAEGILGLYGVICDTALSGAEAISKISNKHYDIVFMDHMMPEMDGIEATKILRESYGIDELVIVALTANAVDGAQKILLDAGMNDYLSKPIDKVQLNYILEEWLPEEKIQKKA